MESQSEYDAKEAFGKIDELIKDGPRSLKEAGATKDEINALKSNADGVGVFEFMGEEMAVNTLPFCFRLCFEAH